MVGAGIGMIVLGYALLYSGISNITTDGKGWGLFQSLINKGGNSGVSLSNFTDGIKPLGNSGADKPQSNDSPVNGAQQV